MRRWLILLLVTVIPLKAWASVATPFAGSADPTVSAKVLSAAVAAHAHTVAAGEPTDTDCCAATDAGSHLHECSHFTMALLPHAPLSRSTGAGAGERPGTADRPLTSVVLDVLLPPPLLPH